MKKLIFLLVFAIFGFGDVNETNASNAQNLGVEAEMEINIAEISEIQEKISEIDAEISLNPWYVKFSNYLNYQSLSTELLRIKDEIKKHDPKEIDEIDELNKRAKTIQEQLTLLNEYEHTPFSTMLEIPNLSDIERVTNPIKIIKGYSNIRLLEGSKDEYLQKLNALDALILKLEQKDRLLNSLSIADPSTDYSNDLMQMKANLSEFQSAKEVGNTTFSVVDKKIDEEIQGIKNDIKAQVKHAGDVGIWILAVIVIAFLFKYTAKRYIKDNERLYLTNKVINVINLSLIILILLFGYIENISYLVTILGFASAGLAIAMKDMFMSMLGWCVITIGGAFRVGDRLKVTHPGGGSFVGDIIDISLLRITIYEDITYTTYTENRRAGRIVFIPNNYIFTDLISNYSHSGMKTVWDGIDILLTFDSNHKKAMWIIKDITRQYSKGFTDIAKKQMVKLRDQYSIRNSNVEPRIFSFFEPYGIKISVWYMTNAHATLALRSTISAEILEALKKEEDITIAYPTQIIYHDKKQYPVHLDDSEPKD